MNGHEEDREFAGFAATVRGEAERDEAFWTRQGALIRERTSRRATIRRWGVAVAAAATLAAAVLQLTGGNVPQAPEIRGATGPGMIESAESDDELLAEIEQAVAREVPTALEPAAWLLEQ